MEQTTEPTTEKSLLTLEDLRINQTVLVTNLRNYQLRKPEPVPFKARINQLTDYFSDYPTVRVKSLETDRSYEIYPDQVEAIP